MLGRSEDVYAPPREVAGPDECDIYHTIDLPGFGLLRGQWDLRGHVDEYLGNVPLRGKRVLEVGTATGFLAAEMERRGAELVCYDLSENEDWDLVPFHLDDAASSSAVRKEHIRRINNGWWLTHNTLNLSARMVYGSVYRIPAAIGRVDVAVFGSVLLHLRDPFLALQSAAALTDETIIVTDVVPEGHTPTRIERVLERVGRRIDRPLVRHRPPEAVFLPDPAANGPDDTWWNLSPELVERFLGVLGFPRTTVTFHEQDYANADNPERLYTVVGRRDPSPEPD